MTSNRPYLLRAVHEWICDNGLTPYIMVDAGYPGLKVPPQAVSDGRVVLNLAPRAVSRLDIGNDIITFMARFSGASHAVSVPLAAVQAVYARENGQGMLLAEDSASPAPPVTAVESEAPRTGVPTLQTVPTTTQDASDTGDESAPAADTAAPDKPRPKGKPNLHVVK